MRHPPEHSGRSAVAPRTPALLRYLGRASLAAGLIFSVLPCAAQTLAEALAAAKVPATGFTQAELAQPINAVHGTQGQVTYVAYVRVGNGDAIQGSPVFVRYDAATGALLRRDMPAGEADSCCGAPDGIDFTHSYVIASFSDTPSAETALVLDPQLRLTAILYGFEFHEVLPDQVVFIENMVHFAAQHPERLRFVNLRTGETRELYPLKDDRLRDLFIKFNSLHMPSPQECQASNDPCDPKIFDEDIEFLSAEPNEFHIRVSRLGTHPGEAHGPMEEVPFEAATYTYQLKRGRWFYCEQEQSAAAMFVLHRSLPFTTAVRCKPNVPVIADPNAGMPNPFAVIIRKVN